MAIQGKHVLLAIWDETSGNYLVFGEQTGLSTEESTNMVEMNSKQKKHVDVRPGKDDGKVTVEVLVDPADPAYQLLKKIHREQKKAYLKRFRVDDNLAEVAGSAEYAEALLENFSRENGDDEAGTLSAEFQMNENWHTTPQGA